MGSSGGLGPILIDLF